MANEMIDQESREILSSKRVLIRHPGSRRFIEMYPTPSMSSTQLAEATNSKGRYRVTGNSLTLGGQTNFTISSSSIIGNLALHATITVANNRALNHGWLFNAIDRCEVTFSNSLLQSVIVSGLAFREVMLAYCKDAECREKLLDQAGIANGAVGGTYSASIPIGNLITSAVGIEGQYPIDQSTLSGPIQIALTFNRAGSFTAPIAAGGSAFPTTFDKLALTVDTSDLLSGAFSIRNAMSYDPELSYNIPCKYLSVSRRTLSFDPAGGIEQVVQLTSAPSGMLSAIVLLLKPTSEFNSNASAAAAAAGYFPIGGSVNLKTLRLTYSGTDLYRADSRSEVLSNYRSAFCGDTLTYRQRSSTFNPGTGVMGSAISQYDSNVIVIPFGYNMKKVMSGHLVENLPSYSGATLELRFTVDNQQQRSETLAAAPFTAANQVVLGSGAPVDFTLEVCYIIESILEISGGSVDLAL